MPCRVERNIDRILELLAERRRARDVLHAGLDRRALSADDSPHRRRRPRAREPRLRASPCDRAGLRRFPRRHPARQGGARGHRGRSRSRGYRAPSFSIGPDNPWAFDCIAEAGYRYSSSVYPIRHDHYGVPDAPRFAHEVQPGLLEVPVTTVRLLRSNWPAGGGGYFRLLPYCDLALVAPARSTRVDGQPAMFYFHPWELDPEQPRVQGPGAKTRFRHYVNLRRMEAAAAPARCGFPLGSRGSRLPRMAAHDGARDGSGASRRARCRRRVVVRAVRRPPTPRAGMRSSRPAPTRRSSTASAGARSSRTSFAIARTTCSPSAAARSRACCRSPQVKSRLFGHALVSLPFCVYGGPAASDAAAERALDRRRGRARADARRRPPRAPQPCGEVPRLAAPGPLRDVPQGAPARRRGEPAGDSAQAAGDGAQGDQATDSRARSTQRSIASSRCTRTTSIATARRRSRRRTSRGCSASSATTARC